MRHTILENKIQINFRHGKGKTLETEYDFGQIYQKVYRREFYKLKIHILAWKVRQEAERL